MNCPDCNTKMNLITIMYLEYKDSVQEIADPYWKCPKCKIEVEAQDDNF